MVYLPPAPDDAAGRPSVLHPPRRGSAETVLLVEDDDGVRKLAQRILEKHGYNVLEARNGGEALLLCRKYADPIHILVTDVVMPKLSGAQLAEQLAPLRPTMKVLYLSGYTDAIVQHSVLDADMPFLQKPFRPDDLARKVREVLDSR
jgi:DNA-binding NtrC family response regulator